MADDTLKAASSRRLVRHLPPRRIARALLALLACCLALTPLALLAADVPGNERTPAGATAQSIRCGIDMPPETFTLTVSTIGPGAIHALITDTQPFPAVSTRPAGQWVYLIAQADPNGLFLSWTIDGKPGRWDSFLSLCMDGDHTVVATFAPGPQFTDVPYTLAGAYAIDQLAARGAIRGYGDGTFGPADLTKRAQMAALIARAMGWDAETGANPFPDRCAPALGCVDDELWRDVGTLNRHDVARGYPDGTYDPFGDVLNIQVVSFVTRAMVAKGYWQAQPERADLYPNVPASSGARADLATYYFYVGALPDFPTTTPFNYWDVASTRSWFARVLWDALYSHFR